MNANELLDPSHTFQDRLRDGLDHIAHANPVPTEGIFDPNLVTVAHNDGSQPRRTGARVLAAAAAAAVVVGGLAFLAQRDESPATSAAPPQEPNTTNETASPGTTPATAAADVASDQIDQLDGGESLPRFALSEPGWTMTYASESELGGSYRFEHTDGRTLEASTIAGGEDGFEGRMSGEHRVVVGLWHVLDYAASPEGGEPGRYRADSLRGDWTYEFDGAPFGSLDAFMTTVAGAHTVDENEWQASVPDEFVSGSEQASVAAELLQDVPLPDGFDIASLYDGTSNDRYQFIAHVSGAVTCAWLDQWFTGQESGDMTSQQDAAEALATSPDWAMLIEIADQGGWSSEVWLHADAVNGGEGVAGGGGPQPPSREEANGALGCDI